MRSLTDLLYRVPAAVKRFKENHPDDEVIIAQKAKARLLDEDSAPGFGFEWLTAKRGVLILSSTGLHCVDWFIPLDSIHRAELIKTASGAVLKISAGHADHYQFGLDYNSAWEEQSILPIRIKRESLKMSLSMLSFLLFAIMLATWSIIYDYTHENLTLYTAIAAIFVLLAVYRIIRADVKIK